MLKQESVRSTSSSLLYKIRYTKSTKGVHDRHAEDDETPIEKWSSPQTGRSLYSFQERDEFVHKIVKSRHDVGFA
jgi:hypothetical protein